MPDICPNKDEKTHLLSNGVHLCCLSNMLNMSGADGFNKIINDGQIALVDPLQMAESSELDSSQVEMDLHLLFCDHRERSQADPRDRGP